MIKPGLASVQSSACTTYGKYPQDRVCFGVFFFLSFSFLFFFFFFFFLLNLKLFFAVIEQSKSLTLLRLLFLFGFVGPTIYESCHFFNEPFPTATVGNNESAFFQCATGSYAKSNFFHISNFLVSRIITFICRD